MAICCLPGHDIYRPAPVDIITQAAPNLAVNNINAYRAELWLASPASCNRSRAECTRSLHMGKYMDECHTAHELANSQGDSLLNGFDYVGLLYGNAVTFG